MKWSSASVESTEHCTGTVVVNDRVKVSFVTASGKNAPRMVNVCFLSLDRPIRVTEFWHLNRASKPN